MGPLSGASAGLPGTGSRWIWARASVSASRPLTKAILPFSPESTATAGAASAPRAARARTTVTGHLIMAANLIARTKRGNPAS